MLKLLQGGNFVKINLELVLCFVYLGSTWITPICQIQLQKNLTVFVSPQLHCTFIISPSGKTLLEHSFQTRRFMVLLQFLRQSSRLSRMPLFPEPKFRGPKRTKMPTPQTRVELHIHLDGCLRMETVWELYKQKGDTSG